MLADEDRVISVANFEVVPLAAALDLLRIALAPALTSAGERIVKLLETPWSGLPTGLVVRAGVGDAGLGYLGIAAQSIVAEARLLAQPVSFELASSAHAEGIEDRATMAPLAARRVAEMVALGRRVVAIELVVAAQAADLRARPSAPAPPRRGMRSANGPLRGRGRPRAPGPRQPSWTPSRRAPFGGPEPAVERGRYGNVTSRAGFRSPMA